jgi:hypothetical protein
MGRTRPLWNASTDLLGCWPSRGQRSGFTTTRREVWGRGAGRDHRLEPGRGHGMASRDLDLRLASSRLGRGSEGLQTIQSPAPKERSSLLVVVPSSSLPGLVGSSRARSVRACSSVPVRRGVLSRAAHRVHQLHPVLERPASFLTVGLPGSRCVPGPGAHRRARRSSKATLGE